jgi:two-component system, OmpR family, phosphate regulon sensor histidine kinase PhoR
MAQPLTRGLTRRRLRAVLLGLFVLLAAPAVALVLQTQRQLRWESYHQYDTLAGELALRIDAELQRLVALEEARSYADYGFLTLGEGGSVVQRSALSQDPARTPLAGALGWFQIDAEGRFSSPLLPATQDDPAGWGLDPAQVDTRRQLVERVRAVITAPAAAAGSKPASAREDKAAAPASTDAIVAQDSGVSVLEQLSSASASPPSKLGRIDELQVDTRYRSANVAAEQQQIARLSEQRLKANVSNRALRKEQSAEPVFADAEQEHETALPQARVRLFESELDPFQFRALDATHGLLYRRVWRDGRRGLQGVVIELEPFLQAVVVDPFEGSALAPVADLVIALQDEVLRAVSSRSRRDYRSAGEVEGELLHRARLSAPFDDLELLWSVRALPAGPGAWLIGWTALILFATLALGLFALYRLGLRQIALAAQQRDFVSAVSHELKTPLTSIRMYAEMLRAGWASEAKRNEYYAYIHDESERLSRLIGNVLQLARLERDELALQPRPVAVAALVDMLRSKVHAQVEHAGFELHSEQEAQAGGLEVVVDPDAFVQILINLVDNALKFAARAERRVLELQVRTAGRGRVEFALRDHGPGVAPGQVQRIFEPFQRGGSELTREAPGTGIGLALARQLARAMGGELEFRAGEPGAVFALSLPLAGVA